jgi:CRISPR-associated protein Cas1
MAFRNVYLQNDVYLKIKDEQLVVKKTNEETTIPLEDLNSVCIESLQTVITTYTLQKFIEHDIIVYVCDEKHLPTGIIIGTNNYSRQLKNIKQQMEMSKPLTKRIWQDIVKVKILNQAKCLQELNIKQYTKLEEMLIGITSGDKNNVEAKAASLYFKLLFGSKFNRSLDCIQNAALNYGYAIVRGMIARTLVMYGFEPSIGIFHHSQLNNFNLADDFIECFRPLVDLYVLTNIDLTQDELTPENKKEIYKIINCLVLIDGKKFNIHGAIEYMIKSFSTSMNKNENLIKLPYLIKLEEYRYA